MGFIWLITRNIDEDRRLILSEVAGIPGKITRRKINGNRRIWQAKFYYGPDSVDGWIESEYERAGSKLGNCTYTRKAAGV